MAQPASIVNTAGQSTDTGYASDGISRVKFMVGTKDVGLTPDAGYQGVATHQDADTFAASDGVVVAAGVDGTDAVHRFLTDAAGRMEVAVSSSSGSVTDKSGTIVTGNTAQTLAAALTGRKYLFIQNIDATEDLWFNFTTTAVKDYPSVRLGPGESFVMESGFVSGELISIIALTTGHKFTAKEA